MTCTKTKTRGKYAGMVCEREDGHRGDCKFVPPEGGSTEPVTDEIPFTQPEPDEAPEVPPEQEGSPDTAVPELPPEAYPAAAEALPAPVFATVTTTNEATRPADEYTLEPPVKPTFVQPAQEQPFEEPDLRTVGRYGSSYQHPKTGQKVPSVTSISGLLDKSSFLVPWSAKLAAEWVAPNVEALAFLPDDATRVTVIKEQAKLLRNGNRDIGSLAHNTIEAIIHGEHVQVDPRVQPQVDGFLEWREEFVQQIIVVEATVWSYRYDYAGTLDLGVVLKTGELALVDVKTGKDVHEDAALQITALARADSIISTAGEIANLPWQTGGVLHLPQPVRTATGKLSVRGKWSYRPVQMRDVDWDCFLALRRAHDWEKHHAGDAIGGKQTKLWRATA